MREKTSLAGSATHYALFQTDWSPLALGGPPNIAIFISKFLLVLGIPGCSLGPDTSCLKSHLLCCMK